jgi:S1-C subfamily serine protease
VLVTEVEAGSAAATSSTFRSGLLRNDDVILEVDGVPTPSLDEFKRVLDEVRSRKPSVLLVYFQRGRYNGYAGLNLKIGDNAGGGAL